VGLTTAACLAEIGHNVFCADNDSKKLNQLRDGHMPFYEPHLEGIVDRNRKAKRLEFGPTEEGNSNGGGHSSFAWARHLSKRAKLTFRPLNGWLVLSLNVGAVTDW